MKKTIAKTVKSYEIGSEASRGPFCAVEWRDARPVWNHELCFKCGICSLSCPDAAVLQVDDGFYDVNPDRCKGCGICSEECINEAITMSPEEK